MHTKEMTAYLFANGEADRDKADNMEIMHEMFAAQVDRHIYGKHDPDVSEYWMRFWSHAVTELSDLPAQVVTDLTLELENYQYETYLPKSYNAGKMFLGKPVVCLNYVTEEGYDGRDVIYIEQKDSGISSEVTAIGAQLQSIHERVMESMERRKKEARHA